MSTRLVALRGGGQLNKRVREETFETFLQFMFKFLLRCTNLCKMRANLSKMCANIGNLLAKKFKLFQKLITVLARDITGTARGKTGTTRYKTGTTGVITRTPRDKTGKGLQTTK